MTRVVDSTLSHMTRQVKADLAFFPGRFAMAWRTAALCALMTLIAMVYEIPESAISCYLIIFVMKPDAVESMVMAIAVTILVALVVGLVFLLIHFTLENPPLRMAALIMSSFLFLYLGSASKLGPVGSIIALVIAFVMTLLSDIPMGEVATRALLYAWLMAVSPMLLIIGFNLFLGRPPHRLLRDSLSERLLVAAQALQQPNSTSRKQVRLLLHQGQNEHQQRALLVRIFHLRPSAEVAWLEKAIKSTYRLLLAISVLPASTPDAVRLELAAYCSMLARGISIGHLMSVPQFKHKDEGPEIDEIKASLINFANPDNGQPSNTSKDSFFSADAFTNSIHQRFAIKTTLAALICYLVYTALDWQDIHTAMITCYVVALGTTGETVHKLVLRIIGCLVGAAMGVTAIVFIIPYLNDIGELMALVFGGVLLAAWVSCGNERISYAGVQIGLAFLLTVLQGFGPSSDMAVALDRVLGILLGNLVMYLIFTLLWPVAISASVRIRINRALNSLAAMASLPAKERAKALTDAANVEKEIFRAHEELKLTPFEPRRLRPTPEEHARLKSILLEIEALCPILFLSNEKQICYAAQLRHFSEDNKVISATENVGKDRNLLRQELSPPESTIQHRINRLEKLLGN